MNKGFSKKDLRTGHIVRFRDGETAMLVGDTFFGSIDILDGNFNNGQLNQYDEYLKDIEYGYDTDIMEVYYIKSTEYDLGVKGMIENIPEEHAELIWKREEEIDWSKVPKWTKVLVREDFIGAKWERSYFLGVDDKGYKATFLDEFTSDGEEIFDYWDEIKPFDEKDIKEEWYK